MSIRTMIVDDEAPARAKLRRLLSSELEFEIVGEAASGRDAVTMITSAEPDVVFLDIQMPELDGFGVLAGLDERMPHVVFVTAHDEHAIKAFEVRALDYLLKPVTPARFRETLDRVCERLRQATPAPANDLREVAADLASPAQRLDRMLVHDETRALFLPVERIDWFDADRNYVRIHAGQRTFTERATIAALVERLDRSQFLQINRSQIVRVDAVKEMHPWSHGDYHVILQDGTRLVWSRRCRAQTSNAFRAGS
jgi:two-component system LytT family response regulator